MHDDYHAPTDDIDKIEFDKMEKVGKLAFLSGWILATQKAKPKYEDIPMDERTEIVKESLQV